MDLTKYAQKIVDIVESSNKKERIHAANLCLNTFWDSVAEHLSVQKEKFESPNAYYKQLEDTTRDLLKAFEERDQDEFKKHATSLHFMLNIPVPKPDEEVIK